MQVSFIHESNHFSKDGETCDQIEVIFDIWCHDLDGDYGYDDIMLWNVTTEKEIKLEDLPQAEQAEIEKRADAMSSDKALDAYQDYCEGQADAAYDAWKDRD